MVELTQKMPFENAGLPVVIGGCVIDAGPTELVHSIMPFDRQVGATSSALENALGLKLPAIGQSAARDGCEVIWTGHNQWFLIGAGVPKGLSQSAGVSDQSDGWAVLSLRGNDSAEVMSRLCPLDLRHLTSGQVARTEFAHMMSIILPREGGYDIWVMRSFAKTALEHIRDAATGVGAIKSLPS